MESMFLILTLGILAVLMSLAMTPIVRDGIGRFFLDLPDGGRKAHTTPVPRVGGIAIVLAYVATFAIAFSLPFSYTFVLHKALPHILALTLVGTVVFLTGVLDDLVGLTAWQKLIGIGGASVLAYFAGIQRTVPVRINKHRPILQAIFTAILYAVAVDVFKLRSADGHELEVPEVYIAYIRTALHGSISRIRRRSGPTVLLYFTDTIYSGC